MKEFIANLTSRIAPRTLGNLRMLEQLNPELQQGPSRFLAYERELRTLRREIDELRRENRRVAELYDVVFDWVREQSAARSGAPAVDEEGTLDRVRGLVAREQQLPPR